MGKEGRMRFSLWCCGEDEVGEGEERKGRMLTVIP